MQRKFNRDHFRRQVGNKGLQLMWATFQRKKYGDDYPKICKPKKVQDTEATRDLERLLRAKS